MSLVIYINEHYDEEMALFNLEKELVLLVGDGYHNKIQAKIEGYLEALREYELIPFSEEVPVCYINYKHEHYKMLEFYYEGGE